MNEDQQQTHLLLDNSLLQLERRKLDIDGHLGIINSRIDRRRQDVASLEVCLDDLEAVVLLSMQLELRRCISPTSQHASIASQHAR